MYGGDPGNAGKGLLVTVGSHDWPERISNFTRRNEHRVDLLAPGCEIPTFTPAGSASGVEPVRRSGTSYAAPLVTMIASLMYLEGMDLPGIKTRLALGVDVDGALDTLVWSRGRLNVPKSLSVWEDRVDYETGPPGQDRQRVTVYGKLLSIHKLVILCNRSILHGDLLKLSKAANSSQPDSSDQFYAWQRSETPERPQDIIRHPGCSSATGEDLVISDSETGQLTAIPVADILDFVAKSL
jgi:hypothetical protein